MKIGSRTVAGAYGSKIFDFINYTLLILICVVTLYPFINTIAISFNDSYDSLRGGITVWPRMFTLHNYNTILRNKDIYSSTIISVLRTVIGCVTSTAACFMAAYAISRKEFVLGKFLSNFYILTMYVGGGIIPSFILMKELGLTNNFLVYILPMMVNGYYIMVIRSYLMGISDSIIESARIDGAGEYRIMFRIIYPLCVPVLVTIGLFSAVRQWNGWFDTFLYCSSKQSLSTLQYELQKVLSSSQQAATQVDFSAANDGGFLEPTPQSIRATMTVVASFPIMVLYPFLQKYFVTGLTLGGVKG